MLGELLSGAASLLGGFLNRGAAEKQADKNIAAQREFAQHGVQWKVDDAKAAGISPIYALGAPTTSFSNVTGDTGSVGNAVAAAGQDIGRAVNSTSTQSVRLGAYTQAFQSLTLKKMDLENQLLGAQIAKVNQTGTPPFPGDRYLVDGQSGSGLVTTHPMSRTAVAPGAGSQEPGATSDIGYGRTTGGWAPQPSSDAMQHMSNDFLGMLSWNLRNRLLPTIGSDYNPPAMSVPSGKHWVYNPLRQEYQLTPDRPFPSWFYGSKNRSFAY